MSPTKYQHKILSFSEELISNALLTLKSLKTSRVLLVITSKNWRCLSGQTFFGLTDNYMEAVYEQFFLLKHHGGWSFMEIYNLPVGLRIWFLQRLEKQFDDEAKAVKKASRR